MSIGVILFETAGERLWGDAGFEGTFSFPVEYGITKGSYRDLIDGSTSICQRLCQTAQELEARGVSAIVGDCGLMSLYQKEISDSVDIPVISSSLLLVPVAQSVIGCHLDIGIITGHSALLANHHLEAAGSLNQDALHIYGMQNEPHFHQVIIKGVGKQDYAQMRDEVLHAVSQLQESTHKLGAVILECSNLAVFAGEINRAYGLPVFDINTGVYLLHEVGNKKIYTAH